MAKKKTEEKKRPAYGTRPEPVECVAAEPKEMHIPVPKEDKEQEVKTDENT